MGSKRFVTVCACLRRLLPVCDSLRQFVTVGASQTVCDCHIANPGSKSWLLNIVNENFCEAVGKMPNYVTILFMNENA